MSPLINEDSLTIAQETEAQPTGHEPQGHIVQRPSPARLHHANANALFCHRLDFISAQFVFDQGLILRWGDIDCLEDSTYSFQRGTPLRIILRDGRHIYDHYEDHGSGLIVLRNHGKLQLKSVKAITIWKRGVTS